VPDIEEVAVDAAGGPRAVGHDLDGRACGHGARGEQVDVDTARREVDLDDVTADPARGLGRRELAVGDPGGDGLRREQLVEHLAARARPCPRRQDRRQCHHHDATRHLPRTGCPLRRPAGSDHGPW
jgi:hypothetical protein